MKKRIRKRPPVDVRRLDVLMWVGGETMEAMLSDIKNISRRRTARLLIEDRRYPLVLVRQLNDLVVELPPRISLLVVREGTTISGADARLTLSGPLSESSLAEVKRQMVTLRQRVLIGSGWILESLRNDIPRTHDVRFMEE